MVAYVHPISIQNHDMIIRQKEINNLTVWNAEREEQSWSKIWNTLLPNIMTIIKSFQYQCINSHFSLITEKRQLNAMHLTADY